jgi:hypothetical protein
MRITYYLCKFSWSYYGYFAPPSIVFMLRLILFEYPNQIYASIESIWDFTHIDSIWGSNASIDSIWEFRPSLCFDWVHLRFHAYWLNLRSKLIVSLIVTMFLISSTNLVRHFWDRLISECSGKMNQDNNIVCCTVITIQLSKTGIYEFNCYLCFPRCSHHSRWVVGTPRLNNLTHDLLITDKQVESNNDELYEDCGRWWSKYYLFIIISLQL